MSKHTPGHWCLYGEYGGEHEIVSVANGERSYVARAADRDDANLIKFAPEMLEALKVLVAEIKQLDGHCPAETWVEAKKLIERIESP